ncbi:T. brucei spp.-specific protein [Trypanosoma brucei gambiense DAL972]|uniref:T. brucei spp.-specific protein n=1 Tax=Trypanosoma brucei gambiense (strain MHOM/CI/86/DAL972) TaxID=679716 RepID=C9ZXD0_TRYB9|nr:T. brucei spp.-specific protein [Trypanosoma brucei gambiense DAL972]CBH14074.1 T. brucei spp.-specific protein [Trypanosoma brucei gambiense DAL972]|eukprot:XP_011776345.1 T. brucei spp.-specific protein [Trypanosoma brucei gambiense DAL972]
MTHIWARTRKKSFRTVLSLSFLCYSCRRQRQPRFAVEGIPYYSKLLKAIWRKRKRMSNWTQVVVNTPGNERLPYSRRLQTDLLWTAVMQTPPLLLTSCPLFTKSRLLYVDPVMGSSLERCSRPEAALQRALLHFMPPVRTRSTSTWRVVIIMIYQLSQFGFPQPSQRQLDGGYAYGSSVALLRTRRTGGCLMSAPLPRGSLTIQKLRKSRRVTPTNSTPEVYSRTGAGGGGNQMYFCRQCLTRSLLLPYLGAGRAPQVWEVEFRGRISFMLFFLCLGRREHGFSPQPHQPLSNTGLHTMPRVS